VDARQLLFAFYGAPASRPVAQSNPRPIRRAIERGEPERAISVLLYREIMRLVEDSRAGLDSAVKAVAMAASELDDRRAEASLSWADGEYPEYKRRDQ
jgi:hypothetical protein